MTARITKGIIIGVIVGLMVLGVSGWAAAKVVKVGAAINMTGPASSWGQFHARGQQDYFRYVNEVKGGVAGNRIEMLLVDTAYKVPEAVAAVRKFAVQEKVDMIATWGAGEGLAAKPIVQTYKIPTINYSTSWEILEPPIDYMYLPFGSYKMDCYAILDYIRAVHRGNTIPKVGLLTYNNAYGRSIHKPSREYAKKVKIDIVAVEEFPQDRRSQYGTPQAAEEGRPVRNHADAPRRHCHHLQERRPHRLQSHVFRHLDLYGS